MLQIAVGQTIQLRSGSPPMVVLRVRADGLRVHCAWFDARRRLQKMWLPRQTICPHPWRWPSMWEQWRRNLFITRTEAESCPWLGGWNDLASFDDDLCRWHGEWMRDMSGSGGEHEWPKDAEEDAQYVDDNYYDSDYDQDYDDDDDDDDDYDDDDYDDDDDEFYDTDEMSSDVDDLLDDLSDDNPFDGPASSSY